MMALTSDLRRLSLTWDSGAASSQVHGVRRLHLSSLACTTLMCYTGVHVTTAIRGEAGWALSGRKRPKAAQAPAPEPFQRNRSCWALTTRELGKTARIKGNRLRAKVFCYQMADSPERWPRVQLQTKERGEKKFQCGCGWGKVGP